MTNRQVEANRQRAGLSKGKMSQAGRDKVRHNAISHGLTARTLLIPGEEQAEYDRIINQLVAEHRPVTLTEEMLVKQIGENWWRLDRAQRAETNLLAAGVEEAMMNAGEDPQAPCDRDFVIGDAFSDNSGQLDRVRRYLTSAERAWHKCIDQLRRVQQDRRKREAEEYKQSQRESHDELRRAAEEEFGTPEGIEFMKHELRYLGIVSQKPENKPEDQPDPAPPPAPEAVENTKTEEEHKPEAA